MDQTIQDKCIENASKILECQICCEETSCIGQKKFVTCKYCDYKVCQKCVQRYLLSQNHLDAQCMNCEEYWNYDYLQQILSKNFLRQKYKTHLTNVMLNIEKRTYGLLMEKIERLKPQKQIQKELKSARTKKKDLINQRSKLQKEYQNKFSEVPEGCRQICMNGDCQGSLQFYYTYEVNECSINLQCQKCQCIFYAFCVDQSTKPIIQDTIFKKIQCLEEKRGFSKVRRQENSTGECPSFKKKYLQNKIINLNYHIRLLTKEIYQKNMLKMDLQTINFIIDMEQQDNQVFDQTYQKRYVFTISCPKNNCKGYCNERGVCIICETLVCKKCHELISDVERHECLLENIQTAQIKKRETKQCPKCYTCIMKLEGCKDFICTQCKTSFNWYTLQPIGKNTNPNYFQFVQDDQKFKEQELQRIKDYEKDINLQFSSTHSRIYDIKDYLKKFLSKQNANIVINLFKLIDNIQTELIIFDNLIRPAALLNEDINLHYLFGQIQECQYRNLLYMRRKRQSKYKNYQQILQSYLQMGQQFLNQMVQNRNRQNIIIELSQHFIEIASNIYHEYRIKQKEFNSVFRTSLLQVQDILSAQIN